MLENIDWLHVAMIIAIGIGLLFHIALRLKFNSTEKSNRDLRAEIIRLKLIEERFKSMKRRESVVNEAKRRVRRDTGRFASEAELSICNGEDREAFIHDIAQEVVRITGQLVKSGAYRSS